jgi:shikimate dehydrogenase
VRTVALVGDPVRQSPSPAMHRAAAATAGIDLDYHAERVTQEELPRAYGRLSEQYLGLNVTRPLKEAILPFLEQVSNEAAKARSVNTVTFRDGSAIGDSTDGAGFLAALDRAGASRSRRAVIVGAGGAGRAVGLALRRSGAEVMIAARDPARASAAAERVGAVVIPLAAEALAPALDTADLLVNATPLGDASPLPESVRLPRTVTVFDLVYRPRITPLLELARTRGCRTVEGVEMLVEQGARSFEIWTGVPAQIDAMRAAALETLQDGARV